jgi:hypothetical protein
MYSPRSSKLLDVVFFGSLHMQLVKSKHYILICFFQISSVQGSLLYSLFFSNANTNNSVGCLLSDRPTKTGVRISALHRCDWKGWISVFALSAHYTQNIAHCDSFVELAWEIGLLHVDACYWMQVCSGMKPTVITEQHQWGILLLSRNTRSNGPQKLVLPHSSCCRVGNVNWKMTQTNFRCQRLSLPLSVRACMCVCVCVCVWSWQDVRCSNNKMTCITTLPYVAHHK